MIAQSETSITLLDLFASKRYILMMDKIPHCEFVFYHLNNIKFCGVPKEMFVKYIISAAWEHIISEGAE